MKTYISFLAILIFVNFAFGQIEVDRCEESISNLEIRGLKLEMTASEVKEKFPTIKIPYADSNNISNIGLIYIVNKNTDFRLYEHLEQYIYTDNPESLGLEGVQAFTISFKNYRTSLIGFYYSPEIKWKSNLEFTQKIINSFSLPSIENWEDVILSNKIGAKILSCGEFHVLVNLSDGSNNATGAITIAKSKTRNLPRLNETKQLEFHP